jgi:type IV fimbrial biogenesis protein FimT
MLKKLQRQRGVTLIELVIGIAILAVVLGFGIPNFAAWMQNLQIRNAAESIQNGLQIARTEALRRNTSIRFQLTSSIDDTCTIPAAGSGSQSPANWVVNVGDASTNDPTDKCASSTTLIQSHTAAEGAQNAVVSTDYTTIVFNGLGQATSVSGSGDIDVSNSTGGACASQGGPMTCMRVTVSAQGQIRMCNPNLTSGTPQGC